MSSDVMSNAAATGSIPVAARRPTIASRLHGIGPLAAALGILGWVVSFIGSWIPSFWGDEAASILSAERPLSTLWPELGRVDAVHGTYYVFLHFWIQLFGASELSVRFPSTIAVGVAVAGTVVLADRLFSRATLRGGTVRIGRRVALIAGIVFAVLPRVDYMGAEGRSYAIGTAIATWLTVFLVTLVRRRESRRLPWIGFAVLFAVSIYMFLYLALLAVVFGVALISSPAGRSVLRRWLQSVVLGVLLASPIIGYALGQHGQISFLYSRHYMTFQRLFVLQWFGNTLFAVVGWALVACAIVALVRARSRSGVIVVAWLVAPMAILFLGNTFVAPMYTIRYLSFCTPAVAILIAVGLVWLTSRLRFQTVVQAAAVLAIIALVLPTDVFERSAYAKDGGSDWRQVSETIGAHAHSGDAVVFDESTRPSRDPRLALRLYPAGFAGLQDVTLRTPYTERAGLWDSVYPVSAVASSLTTTVWDVEYKPSGIPANVSALEHLGYTVVDELSVHRTIVYELIRENQ